MGARMTTTACLRSSPRVRRGGTRGSPRISAPAPPRRSACAGQSRTQALTQAARSARVPSDGCPAHEASGLSHEGADGAAAAAAACMETQQPQQSPGGRLPLQHRMRRCDILGCSYCRAANLRSPPSPIHQPHALGPPIGPTDRSRTSTPCIQAATSLPRTLKYGSASASSAVGRSDGSNDSMRRNSTSARRSVPRNTCEAARLVVTDLEQHVGRRRAQQVGDELQLVHDVLAREERLAEQHLGKDTPDAPDVDRRGVLGVERPAQLWRPVPPRRNVVCPEHGRRLVAHCGAREAKVADLELAVRVGQDVLRLQVTVEDFGRVYVLEAAQHLVEEELVVLRGQVVVRLDHLTRRRRPRQTRQQRQRVMQQQPQATTRASKVGEAREHSHLQHP
eukprot:360262-Chlamydomonas_euryale.AAC.9